MQITNKFQTIVILIMVVLGILLGQVEFIRSYSNYLIMPALNIMLFLVFIQIPLKNIVDSFKNIKFTLTSICINFIWTPLLVYILGKFFLSTYPELYLGFLMLMVTPCTDWYIIFTENAKGNVALSTSILPLNLILQLLLLPIYIFLLGGSSISIDTLELGKSVIYSLIIPLFTAIVVRKIIIQKVGESIFTEKVASKACYYQGYFLNFAITMMFSSQGKILLENSYVLLILLLPILLFFIINFILGKIVGKFIGFDYSDGVSLILTTLARNSPIALAIATAAFPSKPLISLALIIGPLIELPILFLVSKILVSSKFKYSYPKI
ncbi:arsenic resistance protein [Cetobacterium somerae]|uniref:arsenic resistance protein n=1 Tax=Cetobacterium somerae TaxID=188913 RepID=UPI00211DC500|nr:bile acid:sodium symporter [Cetobacterium somerae]MCQ9627309.1 arsenic resistance protein [Cetobacterium somerae]